MSAIQGVLSLTHFPTLIDVVPDTGSPAGVCLLIGAYELFLDRAAAEDLLARLDEAIHRLVNDALIIVPPEN